MAVAVRQSAVSLDPAHLAFIAQAIPEGDGLGTFIRNSTQTLTEQVLGVRVPSESRAAAGKRRLREGQGFRTPQGMLQIPCHLTATERSLFEQAAARRGLSLGLFMRMAALMAAEAKLGFPLPPALPETAPITPGQLQGVLP